MRRARARHVVGVMNKTESAWALQLRAWKLSGHVRDWQFERLTLKLADDTRYTPDFLVVMGDDTIEFHETKGHWRDDALVKIKVAAEMFPYFRFRAYSLAKGVWTQRSFGLPDAA